MKQDLKLGIIGLSKGNGHPYSWSAIFNGYKPEYMKDCGFPVIPEYLSKQKFPDDCIKGAHVTHIWTQDENISSHVAKASNIPYVVKNLEDLANCADAILLARDDFELHYEMAKPFIEKGLPIYIDKPLATTKAEAEKIYSLQKYEGQIFTCSAMAYAPELVIKEDIGQIRYIDACVIKDWNKYAIHIIEPVLKLFDYNSKIVKHSVNSYNSCKTVTLNWQNGITTSFKTLYDCKCGFKIVLYGTKGVQEIEFKDTFNSFKNALQKFVYVVNKENINVSKNITMKAIEIIERGNDE